MVKGSFSSNSRRTMRMRDLQKLSWETHNSKAKVIWKSFEPDTNASQACTYPEIQVLRDWSYLVMTLMLKKHDLWMTLHIGGINSSRINLSPEWGLRWYTCNKCLSSNPGPVALQLRVNWPFVLRWGLKGFATSIVNCDCDKGTYKYCDFLLRPYPPLTGIDYA